MYAQKLTTELTCISLCHHARADEDYSDKITTAHSPQSCRRKMQFHATARSVGRSNFLSPLLLNAITACARYCGTQSLLDCLCPLMLNAATACACYS